MNLTLEKLESLYNKYNKFEYIHPDPLEFIHKYSNDSNREIVGLLSSSLAYGNVKQILKSVSKLLSVMGASPYQYIISGNEDSFTVTYKSFKHRFTTGSDIVKLLLGIQRILQNNNSLKQLFSTSLQTANNDFLKAVTIFTNEINYFYPDNKSYLLPSPINKSACKRLMLYLRWMIRKDEVDPGCWSDSIPTSLLLIPLDTHMYNISKQFGFTSRKSADLKTVQEISKNFQLINKEDPIKYDFVLTRFGIRSELKYEDIHSH